MFVKLIRIGKDAELKYTKAGKAVCTVVGAFDIGWGDSKRTTWIEGALWEKRAEALVGYIVKGRQCVVTFDDLEVETYEGQKGFGAKLKGRIVDIQLVHTGESQASQDHQARKQPSHAKPKPVDVDDEIPF